MKITVIIPIYQVEEYIEECLLSVLNQTYKNLEIILINDGTKDDSINKIEKYLIDKRIILINIKNQGVSNARNLGIKKATGDYIHFVDSDDFIEEKTYEILVNELENENIVVFNYATYDNLTKKIIKEKYINEEIERKLKLYKKGSYYFKLTENSCCNKLYKTNFIKKFFFCKNMIMWEDLFWNLVTFYSTNSVKYVDKSLYFYRLNVNNSITNKDNKINKLSNKEKEKYLHSYKDFNEELEKYILNKENEFQIFELLRIKVLQIEALGKIGKKIIFFDEFTDTAECYFGQIKQITEFDMLLKSEIKNCIKNKNIKIKLGKWIFNKTYWKNNIIDFKVLKRRILINLGVKK